MSLNPVNFVGGILNFRDKAFVAPVNGATLNSASSHLPVTKYTQEKKVFFSIIQEEALRNDKLQYSPYSVVSELKMLYQ